MFTGQTPAQPPVSIAMDTQQHRSWLGSLGATFIKMSSLLTLDKLAKVDYLNILLERELNNCIIYESDAALPENTHSLLSSLPKLKCSISRLRDLTTSRGKETVSLYTKDQWNISPFHYLVDGEIGDMSLPSSEIPSVLHTIQDLLSCKTIKGCHTFSTAFSMVPIFHLVGPHKPNLIIIKSKEEPLKDDVSWEDPKLIMELTKEEFTPTSQIARTLHTKAYLMLWSQPWHCFVLGFSITHDILCLHFYNRSSVIISWPINIHDEPRKVIHVISAASCADCSHIGFDLTIKIFPPVSSWYPKQYDPTSADAHPSSFNSPQHLSSSSTPPLMEQPFHAPPLPDLPMQPMGWVLGPDGKRMKYSK
ncbi:hypothetical protein BDN67DRAFT_1015962 [Paxillus ammoniavirescens]|nr:hypothetical protein BDN67DRAFT_1015962 [Paxillus ammoniavirescens]